MAAPKGSKLTANKEGGRPLIYDDERTDEEALALLEWIKDADDDDKKSYLGTFAVQRGYDRWKLTEWIERHEGFRHAYKKAKTWQENKFVRNGLTKKWDPGFTQYVMARVCDPIWKKSGDAASPDETLKQLATAVMNYATAQPQDKGWQKPEEKPKKK